MNFLYFCTGKSCGTGKWCIGGQCVYLCLSDNFDCWCKKTGSTPNCSVCCLTSDNKCQKDNWTQNISEVIFAQKPLPKTPCNFSYATCSKEIQAILDMTIVPKKSSFSKRFLNSSKSIDGLYCILKP
uniref:Uncharacterized protein n=1 Tax=Romanomermis culicivorax TaxID=13658 RepID=A0A915JVN9_ROMCU